MLLLHITTHSCTKHTRVRTNTLLFFGLDRVVGCYSVESFFLERPKGRRKKGLKKEKPKKKKRSVPLFLLSLQLPLLLLSSTFFQLTLATEDLFQGKSCLSLTALCASLRGSDERERERKPKRSCTTSSYSVGIFFSIAGLRTHDLPSYEGRRSNYHPRTNQVVHIRSEMEKGRFLENQTLQNRALFNSQPFKALHLQKLLLFYARVKIKV